MRIMTRRATLCRRGPAVTPLDSSTFMAIDAQFHIGSYQFDACTARMRLSRYSMTGLTLTHSYRAMNVRTDNFITVTFRACDRTGRNTDSCEKSPVANKHGRCQVECAATKGEGYESHGRILLSNEQFYKMCLLPPSCFEAG